MTKNTTLSESCFVIMPYGVRKVANETVDFNWIYDNIFKPAIKIKLENGRFMKAHRADKNPRAGAARTRMMLLNLKSRMALADITGNNPNVHNELGTRLFLSRTSTAIVKQPTTIIPHNLQDDIIVDYVYARLSKKKRQQSIGEIRQYLKRSVPPPGTGLPHAVINQLVENWGTTREPSNLAVSITAAEQAISKGDLASAIAKYKRVSEAVADNPVIMMRLGSLLMQRPSLKSKKDAAAIFSQVADRCENYSDAHLMQGMLEHKIYVMQDRPAGLSTGENALMKARMLIGNDPFSTQVLSSIQKDHGLFSESMSLYKDSIGTRSGVATAVVARREVATIEHLMRGGSELEVEPIYRHRNSETYGFTLRNLPVGTTPHEVARTLSPYGAKNVRMKPITGANRVNAVGRLIVSESGGVEMMSNSLDGSRIRGSSVITNTARGFGGGDRGFGGEFGTGGGFGKAI